MQSSNNRYLSNLDHLRAFAAFQVFCWHFLHLDGKAFYDGTIPPLGLLTQGHTGVALFMCISGYIFTYLTYGMKVNIGKFWLNRALRLVPLMVFWFFFGTAFTEQRSPLSYFSYSWFYNNYGGIVDHNGYWSIYVELCYYAMFPFLLYAIRRFSAKILLPALLIPILYRAYVCDSDACSMQVLSYWTLAGRADQFLWGTAAFYIERYIRAKSGYPRRIFHTIGAAAFIAMAALYYWFNTYGGYSGYHGQIAGNTLWLYMPTMEGIGYSAMIIGYLALAIPEKINRPLSMIGKYSYSIYLGHPHFIQMMFAFIALQFGMPDNLYARLAVTTLVAFPAMIAISAITYRCIELPFLRLRVKYLRPL